ncbi:arsenate reductase (azurin) small subunit [Thiothrix subterranea]|uniref:Arsenate reductase (Azurin) small subunit n=1 Tax=Thiothrix subterranea TaxID=2735563 RepID=A0AA51MKT4_9GAMM|nr:arsenate reductase (azurin) small subunit [Thiothrix subterranea]MDQ5768700.1 arsenate reductase (azurin) small subunit [Thiothrix subterranea]WML84851.1 arsenate reductase (azurin) small subunit [Thiothrix subterranea]
MKKTIAIQNGQHQHDDHVCMSRRRFLLTGGLALGVVALGGGLPGLVRAAGETVSAVQAGYQRQKIGSLSALKAGVPVDFAYPFADVSNILVKLGAQAGGGVGSDKDVVAFNQQCTHMGGPLQSTYKDQYQVLGPCPLHLTTFDLTHHGMVVSGHGTESLPQIMLELEGDDIYAVGVMGLLYGYADNTVGRSA